MAMCSMVVNANGIKVLAKGPSYIIPAPTIKVLDQETGKEAAKWSPTNNSWRGGDKWVSNVDKVENIAELFPYLKDVPDDVNYCPMEWMLTEENGETVLHCYMRMPEDEVTNLWIANEETGILDRETGTLYRARRTSPDVWDTHFGIRAKKGDWIDLKVYFPELPKSVHNISIYGVQNWFLSGGTELNILDRTGNKEYDKAPKFSMPKLVKPEKDYSKNNISTWAVYDNIQLVKPGKDYDMAMWQTKDTTYLAVMCEQNWMTEYWGWGKGLKLVDDRGYEYHLKGIEGLPMEHIFLIKGYSGDYVAFLLKFEPIPLDVATVTYVDPPTEKFEAWGANSDGRVVRDMSVRDLRNKQQLFKYHQRIVMK